MTLVKANEMNTVDNEIDKNCTEKAVSRVKTGKNGELSPVLDAIITGEDASRTDVAVEFVIPVYNEERILRKTVTRLAVYLENEFPYNYLITIADNASTDNTWSVACEIAKEIPRVKALRLEKKGRGRALKCVWLASKCEVVAYMDVDLSTDLKAILPLIAPLVSGHSDIAIGTRLGKSSRVQRGLKREVISRCYNLLLHLGLRVRFSDAQCGFKAVSATAAKELLPLVEDTGWFFDSELLVLAERAGLRIREVPVDWIDDPDSRVNIWDTAWKDLQGMRRLLRGFSLANMILELLIADCVLVVIA